MKSCRSWSVILIFPTLLLGAVIAPARAQTETARANVPKDIKAVMDGPFYKGADPRIRMVQPSNYARTVFNEQLCAAGVRVTAPAVEPNPTLAPAKGQMQAKTGTFGLQPFEDVDHGSSGNPILSCKISGAWEHAAGTEPAIEDRTTQLPVQPIR